MYAQVIVNRPIQKRPPTASPPTRDDGTRLATFTYRLPERLREMALVGHLVQVPLHRSTALGVIASLRDSPPTDLSPGIEILDVTEILDALPVVTPIQIELGRWIAKRYLAPLGQAIRLMLPPGLESRTTLVVNQTAAAPGPLTEAESAVWQNLHRRRGPIQLSSLLGQVRSDDPEAVIYALADKGLIETRYALIPPKPAPPRIQYVRLLADDATIKATLPHLGHASKQADILMALARRASAPLTLSELCELARCSESPVRALVEQGWIEITERRTLIVANPGAETAPLARAPKQVAALTALLDHGGPMTVEDLKTAANVSSAILSSLDKKGLIQRISEDAMVLLSLLPHEVLDRVIELRGAEKQQGVLQMLRHTTGRVWVGGLYAQTGSDLSTLRDLADHGLISLHAEEYDRRAPLGPSTPPQLSADQETVWHEIQKHTAGQRAEDQGSEGQPFVAVLHGVTGSGKTEIYMRALEATLAAGRRAIVLVPEISLTAQTVRRFEARFPGRIAVMHSQLSLGQRYAVWDQVRRGDVDVVIGPRSALFAPISRLGLVVLDEAHDASYKQDEPIPLPAYHARDVAISLGRLTGATVLLGSATPDLVTYHRAQKGIYHLLQLPHRIVPDALTSSLESPSSKNAETGSLPPVRIVDLRQELRAGNRSIFSRPLQEALHRTLAAREQAILFLNRRGAATFVLCRDCGYVARCPKCETPLTLHRRMAGRAANSPARLICHRCSYQQPSPNNCPNCGGQRIRYFGLGTERVEDAVRELVPDARLLRWDRDTARGPDHERHLQAFVDHRVDVLVGTQMIAKGLDLPLVTLVGVISADTALYLPDFGAAERTFQLLTQVAGRAGRSLRGGQVIVQTYNPDHYAIQTASRHDYAAFYEQELAYRRQLGMPPFTRLVALRYSHRDARRCRAETERMGTWLTGEIRRLGLRASLIGPAPCFFSRIGDNHRWQIVVRGPDPTPLLQDVALHRGWRVDIDPVTLL